MSTIEVAAGETFCGTVDAGDTLIVEAGGLTSGATIYGVETVEVGGRSSGDTVEKGGFLGGDEADFPNGGGVNDVTIAGGTVAGVYATISGGVKFSGPDGTLLLDSSLAAPITGFAAGDGIGFPDTAVPGDPVTLTVVGDAVTVHTSLYNASIDIVGASSDNLSVVDVSNGSGNPLAEVPTIVVCFLTGTVIATPSGDRAIETLRPGEFVLTTDGAATPVRWLGRQTVSTRFADPLRVAPVRIRAGAFSDNLPIRDLLVSPDHALMVDGVFVQAGALVNGVSILREDTNLPEKLVYFHVELADHSLILAEGVAAETFIDNVDRLQFDNWDEHMAVGDDTAPMHEMPHPRAKAHRQVPQALRARLIARGVELYGSDVNVVA